MGGKNFSIEKRLNLFFLVTFLILLFAGLLAIQNKNEFIEITGWVRQSYYVEKQINKLHRLAAEIELEKRKYSLDNSKRTSNTIDSLSFVFIAVTDLFENFTEHNSINKKYIDSLQYYIHTVKDFTNNVNSQLPGLSSNITKFIEEMNNKEEQAFYKRSAELDSLKQKGYIITVIIVVFSLVFITNLMFRIRKELKVRHKTEDELHIKSEELIQLNKSRNMLYSIIAHDLRSPFQPIITLAEIFRMDYNILTPEQIKDYAGKLNSVARDVLTLLDNLLEWTKVQTGRMHFSPETIHLRERAGWAFINLQMIAETKNILLVNEIDKNLLVTADMNMTLSIFQNLISNAIKFTPNGGLIKVSCERDENYVLISVSDNGIGMTQEQLKTIFKIESNHSTPGTNRETGSGLGLLLCKELVDIHGGRIWVESEKGKGSTFYFTIPDSIGDK